jgi:hypothetical protein
LQTGALQGALRAAYLRLIYVNQVATAKGSYFDPPIEP